MGAEGDDQQQQQLRNFLVRIPSHQEVLEKSQPQSLPSLFRPSSSSTSDPPPASFTQAFSFVKNTEFYTPPPRPPPSSSNDPPATAATSSISSGNIAPGSVSQGRNGIIVSHRQKGNPILKHIRNVRWTYADIVPDYLLGQNTCALYISVEECARYLETIKTYENKPADLIQMRTDNDYLSKLSIALTTVRRVNKNDVVTLGSAFGTLSGIMGASMEDLARCPGIGEHKVKRLYDTFHEPFRRITKYSGTPMRTEVASQDNAENGEDQTKESGRDKVDEAIEAKHPQISVRSALSLAYAKYGKKIVEQGDNVNNIDEPIDIGATSEMCLDGDVNKKRID